MTWENAMAEARRFEATGAAVLDGMPEHLVVRAARWTAVLDNVTGEWRALVRGAWRAGFRSLAAVSAAAL